MKILILTDRFPPHHEGGYGLKCKETADWLEASGHEVVVLTTKYGLNKNKMEGNIFRLLDTFTWDDSKIKENGYIKTQIERAWKYRKNYRTTKRLIKNLKPDLLYVCQLYDISILPVAAAQKMGVNCVYDVSSYWLIEFKKYYESAKNIIGKLFKYLLTGVYSFDSIKFDNMIYASKAVRKKYIDAGFNGLNPKVIHGAIHNCYSGEIDALPEYKDKIRRIVCAGRIVEDKGIHIAVEAFSHMVNVMRIKDIKLTIIGSGPDDYLKRLEDIIERGNITNLVEFKGEMPYMDLLREYRDYYILLFPSIWEEPFGRTNLEAMGQGLPIVSTDTGGSPEIVEDGITGLLVEAGSAVQMAEAAGRLLEDKDLYHKVRINGLKEIRENYLFERKIIHINKHIKRAEKGSAVNV